MLCRRVATFTQADQVLKGICLVIVFVFAGHVSKGSKRDDVMNVEGLLVFLFTATTMSATVSVALASRAFLLQPVRPVVVGAISTKPQGVIYPCLVFHHPSAVAFAGATLALVSCVILKGSAALDAFKFLRWPTLPFIGVLAGKIFGLPTSIARLTAKLPGLRQEFSKGFAALFAVPCLATEIFMFKTYADAPDRETFPGAVLARAAWLILKLCTTGLANESYRRNGHKKYLLLMLTGSLSKAHGHQQEAIQTITDWQLRVKQLRLRHLYYTTQGSI